MVEEHTTSDMSLHKNINCGDDTALHSLIPQTHIRKT